MNKHLFRNYDDMLAEADKLVEEDRDDSHDRSAIGAFYNGMETMSESEAQRRGITELTNHLFGYDSMSSSREQIVSAFTKSPTTFVVEVEGKNEAEKQQRSMRVTQYFNDAINRSRRMRAVYESIGGDATLVGSAFLCNLHPTDWCPSPMRPLVPRDTGVLACDVPYAAIPSRMSLAKLYEFDRIAEKQEKAGMKVRWNRKGIKDAIQWLEGNTGVGGQSSTGGPGNVTPEEQESANQKNAGSPASYRMSIPVYYVIQTRDDETGAPCDMTVLARHTDNYRQERAKKSDPVESLLFDGERVHKCADDWLTPLFLDCSLGSLGESSPQWHRTMGLGRLNYECDVDVERFFNDAMQGSREQLRRLYTVKAGTDMELVEKWAAGEDLSNVIPEGVSIAETGKSTGFQYAFNSIQMLQAQSRKNGNMALANSGGMERGTKELEVQALERQGRNAMAISNKMDHVYEVGQQTGYRMMKSFLQPVPRAGTKGYAEIAYFQECLQRGGIPIELLRQKDKFGNFKNFKIRMNRVAGDGDKVRETMVNRMLMQWLPLFSPQAREVIKRRVLASETNDYQFAEEIVQFNPQPDFKQTDRAQNEGQTMINRGGSDYISPIQPDDLHPVHTAEHLQDLQALVRRGETGEWTQIMSHGFMALGQHTMMHMDHLLKDEAQQAQKTLKDLSNAADRLNLDLIKKQEAEAIAPVDRVKLQQKDRELALRERSEQNLDRARQTSLELGVAKEANRSAEASRKIAREEHGSAYEILAKKHEMQNNRRESVLAGEGKGKTPNGRR